MFRAFRTRRWSTASLLGASVALSALAYLAGREAASQRPAVPAGPTSLGKSNAGAIASVSVADAARAEKKIPLLSAPAGFDERWKRQGVAPRTPENERALAAALEELAAHDPRRALALALAEGNFRLREELRNAVLRGWASMFPDEAAVCAMETTTGDQQQALQAVFAGAARHPGEAARLGTRLCAQNPARAADFGQFLVTALTEAGAYETAAGFAAADTSGNRTAWLNSAYYEWASHQPEQALVACRAISDSEVRSVAFQGTLLGWAMADPPGLATYAMSLPAGEERAHALAQALPRWVSNDAVAASKWIATFDPGPDLDAGVAAVATLPQLINQRPDVAVRWAANIADPILRANTLGELARQWAQKDPEAVRRFIAAKNDLSTGDRTALMDALKPPPVT